jgi:hypothetical protein
MGASKSVIEPAPTEGAAMRSPEPGRFARLATVLATSRSESRDISGVIKKIVADLRADSRVTSIEAPDVSSHFAAWTPYYPHMFDTSGDGLLLGLDGGVVLEFSSPILMQVRVPIKNQPPIHGRDDVPTETYTVAWDGITVIVVWEQESTEASHSAGQVVFDVIEAALGGAGLSAYRQACSPGCEYGFIHQTLALRESPTPGGAEFSTVLHPELNLFVGIVPGDLPLEELPEFLWLEMGAAAREFAFVKNYGQRILDLEHRARNDIGDLLDHNRAHARVLAKPWWRRARELWRHRGWRREARGLIAGLWLALTNIETLERHWDDQLQDLQSDHLEILEFFRPDSWRDERRIRALDTSTILAALDQVTELLESRQLALATGLGALGGAVAGGVVSHL